ncbi:FmdE family protein [Methanoregula sp.]|uniref:FmdE family protein n=1 Tax=Methanoregula sp. TaxID=2052170 RepID=UPI003562DC62
MKMTEMSDYDILFNKAKEFHGHVCPGIVLGTRLTIAGLRELGMTPTEPARNLIVYMEIDRCGTDAVQAITGCSLGHRTLKHKDFGKFAATFVDTRNGNAIRVAVNEKNRAEHDKLGPKDLLKLLSEVPEDEILKIEHVRITIKKEDLPGFPVEKANCSKCGEQISDNRHMVVNGRVLCRNCAGESYYSVIE